MRGGWLLPSAALCGPAHPDRTDIPTGTTVDEFVTALVEHPDLDVTSPVDVTLGGYSGQVPGAPGAREHHHRRARTGPQRSAPTTSCGNPAIYAQGPNALWRIWVLDVDGVRVVVRNDSFPGTTPQIQAQLQSIVDSIQIEP